MVRDFNVIGIDLSGPAGTDRTGVAVFRAQNGGLDLVDLKLGGDDYALYAAISSLAKRGPVVVGLDAPLSYQPGGGMRQRDRSLQRAVVVAGLKPGAVMAPTFNYMAYLTLRGMSVARLLSGIAGMRVVEVHPGAAMILRGAPLGAVRQFSVNEEQRPVLLRWLASQGLRGLEPNSPCESHYVAACAAALASWHWADNRSAWLAAAELPWHPYDFAC